MPEHLKSTELTDPTVPFLAVKARFAWKARGMSFVYAFRGFRALLLREHNAWLHLGAAAAACGLGVWLRITPVEWCLVAFAIGSVLTAEAFNTAIETLADALKPERDPLVGHAKDLAAGGVLFASVAAAAVGALIFLPRLYDLYWPFGR